jgi:hypothetical protein
MTKDARVNDILFGNDYVELLSRFLLLQSVTFVSPYAVYVPELL